MQISDAIALLPFISITAAALVVMLAAAFFQSHRLSASLTAGGLAVSLLLLPFAASVIPHSVTPLVTVDGYTLFMVGLFFLAGIAVTVFGYAHLAARKQTDPGGNGAFYILLLLALLGAAVLAASSHFASFFLGLELLSISLFALIAYPIERERALEAGIKYLVLSGVSSPFLLFGMALVYGSAGTMHLPEMGHALASVGKAGDPYLLAGFALVVVGVAFKLSLVPFHLWTPDIYQGANSPVSGLIATVSKGAVFAVLLRYLGEVGLPLGTLGAAVGLVAMASMLVGNLLALYQDDLKRLLAYSSIAHLGYLLLTLLVASRLGPEAAVFYLITYFVTMLAAFGAITVLFNGHDDNTAPLASCRGLFWTRPWLTGVLTVALVSLAGLPVTAGFMGKFYLFSAAVNASLWPLLATLIIGSVIGLFYYLRVIAVLFAPQREKSYTSTQLSGGGLISAAMIAGLTLLLLAIGFFPSTLIQLAQNAVRPLF